MKIGDKVKIKIHDPHKWTKNAVNTLNGEIGTIEGISKGIYVVRFDPPLCPLWTYGSHINYYHFSIKDISIVA